MCAINPFVLLLSFRNMLVAPEASVLCRNVAKLGLLLLS